jgi:hypothetical protein
VNSTYPGSRSSRMRRGVSMKVLPDKVKTSSGEAGLLDSLSFCTRT